MTPEITRVLDALSFLPSAFAVGGCVRDAVLAQITGEPIVSDDIDVATSGVPERVIELAERRGIVAKATGLNHGTVTLVLDGIGPVEVTTYRKDVSTDGRRATVAWAHTVEDDLLRRDFTMNAMAWNADRGLVDPYGGRMDLIDGELRTVGPAMERFAEDRLRIIRAARFVARFGIFEDDDLYEAAKHFAPSFMEHVSVERVTGEFEKAFAQASHPSQFMGLLHEWGILEQYLPEIAALDNLNQNPLFHQGDALSHTFDVVDAADRDVRWHALFHDVGKAPAAELKTSEAGDTFYTFHDHEGMGEKMIHEVAMRLTLPNALSWEIRITTAMHMYMLSITHVLSRPRMFAKKRRQFQGRMWAWAKSAGRDWREMLAILERVCRADGGCTAENPTGRRDPRAWALFDAQEGIEPIVMGADLIAAGHKPGPAMGETLARLHKHQLSTGQTDKAEIIRHAGRPQA